MSRFIKKRALLTAAITSLVLVAVAVAFYSTTGGGSGGGTNANGYPNALVITNDDADGVYPGTPVTVNGDITNNNTGYAKVGTVSGSVTDVTGESAGNCLPAWFTIGSVDVPDTDDVIPANSSIPFSATLTMANLENTNQDPCKGAELVISWSSN